MPKPVLRGKTWYLKRRVPKRFARIEPRSVVWESLKTDSLQIAEHKAAGVWLAYLEGWEAKLAGRDGDAVAKFRAAQDLAAMRGFSYLTITKVAERPLEEILDRIEAVQLPNGTPDEDLAAALLGTVNEPKLRLSDLVDHVEQLMAHENRFKNSNQMRLWRNPRKKAVNNLIDALGGDIPVVEIGRSEAQKHKKWWQARLLSEGLSAETANKDFNYMSSMLSRFFENLEYDDPPRPYAGIGIRDRHAKHNRKLEVPVDWILEKWFAVGALNGLNDEARDILLISIETGGRQSEIYNLPASSICLDADIPYLNIANEVSDDPSERREIKNLQSTRKMPLVGVALEAALRHPEGFPRYRNKSGYSATVNNFMKNNDLLPSGVTIGGLRHSWESRMKRAGFDSDDRGELMGHSVRGRRGREVYGDEMTLADRLEIAKQIMLPVPDHLKSPM